MCGNFGRDLVFAEGCRSPYSEADPPSAPPFRISLSRLHFGPLPLNSRLDSSIGAGGVILEANQTVGGSQQPQLERVSFCDDIEYVRCLQWSARQVCMLGRNRWLRPLREVRIGLWGYLDIQPFSCSSISYQALRLRTCLAKPSVTNLELPQTPGDSDFDTFWPLLLPAFFSLDMPSVAFHHLRVHTFQMFTMAKMP